MTLLDKSLEFSNQQAVTVTAVATNDIDLGPIYAGNNRDIGAGNDLYLSIFVTTTFSGGTSIAFTLNTDDNAAFSSALPVATIPAVVTASLTAGARFVIAIPRGCEKFLRLNYTVVGTYTLGKVSAYITDSVQDSVTYQTATKIKAG